MVKIEGVINIAFADRYEVWQRTFDIADGAPLPREGECIDVWGDWWQPPGDMGSGKSHDESITTPMVEAITWEADLQSLTMCIATLEDDEIPPHHDILLQSAGWVLHGGED